MINKKQNSNRLVRKFLLLGFILVLFITLITIPHIQNSGQTSNSDTTPLDQSFIYFFRELFSGDMLTGAVIGIPEMNEIISDINQTTEDSTLSLPVEPVTELLNESEEGLKESESLPRENVTEFEITPPVEETLPEETLPEEIVEETITKPTMTPPVEEPIIEETNSSIEETTTSDEMAAETEPALLGLQLDLGIQQTEATSTSCGYVTTDLTLAADVTNESTCFTINASNITLDCAGYLINYSTAGTLGYGVNNTGGYDNVTVKNCNLHQENASAAAGVHGIYFKTTENGTIEDNNITVTGSNGQGIYVYDSCYFYKRKQGD
jgi:hypothetical protein